MLQKRIFYGWWVLVGIFISYTALVGIQVYTLPLLYPKLIDEFGWTPAGVTGAATLFFLTGAIITPFVSSLFDRFSARGFMIGGALAAALGLFCFKSLHTLIQMAIIFMILALSQVCAGQVPTMLIITRWFKRYRGIAVGITLMGPDVGGALFSLIVRHVLPKGGWRGAVSVLMIFSAAMMLSALIFFIRSRPEDKGLLPDGDLVKTETADELRPPSQPVGRTLSEALRMPAFYILAFTTGALWFCMNGILQHQSIFMNKELGVNMETVPMIAAVLFGFSLLGKLSIGYLSDHFNKITIMFMVVITLAIGLTLLRFSSADNMLRLYCYAAIFGIGSSGTFTMIQLVIAEFFSGQSYGKILGILTSVDVAAGGLAITAVAKIQGVFNSYLHVFDMLIALTVVAAILVLILRMMHRSTQQNNQPDAVPAN